MRPGVAAYLAPELLWYIFENLPPKDIINCRAVCLRWKDVVDIVTKDKKLWRKYCRSDYPEVYESAYRQAKPRLTWYKLYKSLSLWPKLARATEEIDEFALADLPEDEIRDFQMLKDGVVGVLKSESIAYYDVSTLKQINRQNITGRYWKYSENDNLLLVLSYYSHLFVIKKTISNPNLETTITYDNVKVYLLLENVLYYVTKKNQIYLCQDVNGELISTFVCDSPYDLMALGYCNGQLYALSYLHIMYVVADGTLKSLPLSRAIRENIVPKMRAFNFLKQFDWKLFFSLACVVTQYRLISFFYNVTAVRMYEGIIIIGTRWGVLSIYHTNDILEVVSMQPLKHYNLLERGDCPDPSDCPILNIHIVEETDGHSILVGLPKKIVKIKYVHSF